MIEANHIEDVSPNVPNSHGHMLSNIAENVDGTESISKNSSSISQHKEIPCKISDSNVSRKANHTDDDKYRPPMQDASSMTNMATEITSQAPATVAPLVSQQEIPAAIERLRIQSVVRVESSSSSSTISAALINISPCFENRKFRRTFQAILLGQIMSICLCGTGIASQKLADMKFNAPAGQSFLNYFFLAFVYGVILFFRPSENRNFPTVLQKRGWKYILLAFIDVEANYLIVYAYQYTNITSVQLLNCFTIPVVMLLSWLFLSVRYMVSHISGVAICLLGVAIIIYNDATANDASSHAQNPIIGDILCLCATILYGIANVSEEFLIKQNDRSEYLGMVGLFGFIISGIQFAIFEGAKMSSFQWTTSAIAFYMLFTVSMFLFYSLVSMVMQKTSALMFNLSVLTASFYSLLAGVFVFNIPFKIAYFFSFVVVLIGSSIYSFKETKEVKRKDRDCICRFMECCCPWATICCGECRPPKSSYTVQDAQAERSMSSASMDIRSEIHSSATSNSS